MKTQFFEVISALRTYSLKLKNTEMKCKLVAIYYFAKRKKIKKIFDLCVTRSKDKIIRLGITRH